MCIQELVNLILTGYATSNVFDGEISLGGTGADEVSGCGFVHVTIPA